MFVPRISEAEMKHLFQPHSIRKTPTGFFLCTEQCAQCATRLHLHHANWTKIAMANGNASCQHLAANCAAHQCALSFCSLLKAHVGLFRMSWINLDHLGLSENVVYPIVPNGFADHYPVFKWLAIIGNINPTFSDILILDPYQLQLRAVVHATSAKIESRRLSPSECFQKDPRLLEFDGIRPV